MPIFCPETSVRNYHYTPRHIPEERRSHVLRGGSLKSQWGKKQIVQYYLFGSKEQGLAGS
jgi:hypothetical protein